MSSKYESYEEAKTSMRVLCLGLGRTGTNSLKAALKQLDVGPIYSADNIISPEIADLWVAQLRARDAGDATWTTAEQWGPILNGYAAVIDNPPNDFPLNLIQAYPEAKVILTVRDSVDDWYRSWMSTIWVLWKDRDRPMEKMISWMERLLGVRDFFNEYLTTGMESESWRTFESDGKPRYMDYNATISNHVPPERLLIYNVKEGWPRLCSFLGLEAPETPFPNVNDSRQWLAKITRWTRARQRAIIWALVLRVRPYGRAIVAMTMVLVLSLIMRRPSVRKS